MAAVDAQRFEVAGVPQPGRAVLAKRLAMQLPSGEKQTAMMRSPCSEWVLASILPVARSQ